MIPRVIPGFFFKSIMARLGKFTRGGIFVVTLVIIAGAIVIIFFKLSPDPPVGDIDYAGEMLSQASSNKADTYSRKLYSEAESDYKNAMRLWREENEKFILFRNYDQVRKLANSSSAKSEKAAYNSITSSNNLQLKLKEKLATLSRTEAGLDSLFGRYPLSSELRSRISRGRMLLKEGEVAFGKGQYLEANRKLSDAEYLLTLVFEDASSLLKDYLKDFPKWKTWAQTAINESRKSGSCTIIVDKYSRRCYIYVGGVRKYEFEAELGRNWVGDKMKMGDKATPEGMYKIVNKYQGRSTQYHKALAIDYPNAEDRERFKAQIASGNLPASARIGNGIQIHGGGGKGVDWTEGCIALKNSEIDMIYNLVKVGTPVTIVGSLKGADEIFN